MANKKRSKRKHLSKDIKTKGYYYVLKTYDILPQSFFTTHTKKMLKEERNDYEKLDKLNSLLRHQVLSPKAISIIINEFELLEMESKDNHIVKHFWNTLYSNQKVSEQFFIENFNMAVLDMVDTELNPWAKEENRSDDLRVLLMLNK